MNLNTLKSFVGKNANIHLKDGAVVVNVKILEVDENRTVVHSKGEIPMHSIGYVDEVWWYIKDKETE